MSKLTEVMQMATTISAAAGNTIQIPIWTCRPWTDAQKRRWMQSQPQSPARVFQEQRTAFKKFLATLSNAQLRAQVVHVRSFWTEEERKSIALPEARHEILAELVEAFSIDWKRQFEATTSIPYEDTLELDRYKEHLARIAQHKAMTDGEASN